MKQTVVIIEFIHWWLEIIQSIKIFKKLSLQKKQKNTISIFVQKSNYYIDFKEKGFISDSIISNDDLKKHLASQRHDTEITINLAPDRYLKRLLSHSNLPDSRARLMSEIDIQENFPFLAEDTIILILRRQNGSGTDYAIVHRSIIEPVLNALFENKLILKQICLEGAQGIDIATESSIRPFILTSLRVRLQRKITVFLSCIIFLLTLITVNHFYARNNIALNEIQTILEMKQKKSKLLREQIDSRNKILKLMKYARTIKLNTVPVSIVWEETTRLLSDTTWLTDMDIRGNQITITGFSNSAADLIPTLAASSMFIDPAFTTQVMKVPGQKGERFSIRMQIINK